jgi:hypothetical protein
LLAHLNQVLTKVYLLRLGCVIDRGISINGNSFFVVALGLLEANAALPLLSKVAASAHDHEPDELKSLSHIGRTEVRISLTTYSHNQHRT